MECIREIIGQAQGNTYKGIKNSIVNTEGIKEDAKENYIKMMNTINIEDWNIWLKEEKENSYTGLVVLGLLGGAYSTTMEIDEVKKMINELFKNGGEVECYDVDVYKFYMNGRLIYTVSSL